MKSLTAGRGLLNVISYGIDAKADAVLSYFIIGNYLEKMAYVTVLGKWVLLLNLNTEQNL